MKITHTYAVSDLHGRYDLWEKIKSHLQENDVIYFLGDAIDRGPDGLKLMQELLADKRVHYIIGNHEEMMLNCGTTLSMLGNPNHYALWLANGGNTTIRCYNILSEEEQKQLLYQIKRLPRWEKYTNKSGLSIFMCHAGTVYGWDEAKWAKRMKLCSAFTWGRDHFDMEWDTTEKSDIVNCDMVIHGHTPVSIAIKEKFITPDSKELSKMEHVCPKAITYCDGHIIDIDMGSCFSNTACLLDLDSLEPIYFKGENNLIWS